VRGFSQRENNMCRDLSERVALVGPYGKTGGLIVMDFSKIEGYVIGTQDESLSRPRHS
jgi:hypothetical protein